VFVLLPPFLAAPSLAADPVFGANSTAMGETGVADPTDNVAITLNPGMLALTERYDFAGSFSFGPQEGLHWSTSAMDGRTSDYVAAGVSYAGDHTNPPLSQDDMPGWVAEDENVENVRRTHDFTGAFSVPMAKRRLAVGMGFTVGIYDFDRHGSGWTFDAMAGVGVRATDWLTFGGSYRNFVPGPNAQDRVPDARVGARAEVATQFAVEADLVMTVLDDRLPFGFGAGGELMLGAARIRAGYKLDEEHVSNIAFGLGWDGDGAGLDFGFLSPVPRLDFQEVIYQVSLRFGASAPMPEEEPF
jgi:hypothetical protein